MNVPAENCSEQGKRAWQESNLRVSPVGNGDFEAEVQFGHFVLTVAREGKHQNLHIADTEGPGWIFEPLEQALPKLRALVKAAELILED